MGRRRVRRACFIILETSWGHDCLDSGFRRNYEDMVPYSNFVIPVKTGISSHGGPHETTQRTSETGSRNLPLRS